MQILEDRNVPGRKVKTLGLVISKEVALHSDVALRVARQRLIEKATDKGGDAILSYSLSSHCVFNGVECFMTGVAVKFID